MREISRFVNIEAWKRSMVIVAAVKRIWYLAFLLRCLTLSIMKHTFVAVVAVLSLGPCFWFNGKFGDLFVFTHSLAQPGYRRGHRPFIAAAIGHPPYVFTGWLLFLRLCLQDELQRSRLFLITLLHAVELHGEAGFHIVGEVAGTNSQLFTIILILIHLRKDWGCEVDLSHSFFLPRLLPWQSYDGFFEHLLGFFNLIRLLYLDQRLDTARDIFISECHLDDALVAQLRLYGLN